MQFIDLKKQYELIKADVLREINEVLDSGQYIMGEKINQLEHKLEDFVGVKHAIAVSDGTKALLIALMALDIKAGDEVIVPDFTFIATASMVALLGARPVFADIDAKTYNLDPNCIESLITPKTRAIIPVSLYGQCADFAAINAIAAKYNLAVIEDAGQGFGASINGKRSCSMTTIACTSFFPSKPLGCYGDGGGCFTNDDELAKKMSIIRIHGQDQRYHHAILGINGRMDTLQAGVLLAKMRVFEEELILRDKIGKRYTELLKDCDCVTPYVAASASHTYAQYSIQVSNREQFIASLKDLGVPTAVHYPIPLHLQPAMKEYHDGRKLSVSQEVSSKIVSLPMHPYLDEALQNEIVAKVKQCL